jgi:hypothetical protein
MKFSVLLPTRNGGAYLRSCIRSILDQECVGMELIVSDNANTDETADVLRQVESDRRVKALKLDRPISVTENWNVTLSAASGDYVLMMGDDDYLLSGYFAAMQRLIRKYDNPDCISHNAYSFVAPNSIHGNVDSYYREEHFAFERELGQEALLTPEQRLSIVRDMFRFKPRIPLNMQTTLVSRAALSRIPGGAFQPPFPDHYALNALLLTASNWLHVPARLLVVGISPKSFGHYVYSHQPVTGRSYLGIETHMPGLLPGNELLNGMNAWLEKLRQDFPDRLQGLHVDRGSYVRRQVFYWYQQWCADAITTAEVSRRILLMSTRDWMGMVSTVADAESWKRALLAIGSLAGLASTRKRSLRPLPGIGSIAEFAHWLTTRKTVNAGAEQ